MIKIILTINVLALSLFLSTRAYSFENINQIPISKFEDIYTFYSKYEPKKNQFETTQKYKEKIEWWNKIDKSNLFFSGMSPIGVLPKYNADKKDLDYYVPISNFHQICFKGVSNGVFNLNSARLSYESERSTYTGENAYGVKKEVNLSMVEEESIIITNISKIKLYSDSKYSKSILLKLKNIDSDVALKSIVDFKIVYKCDIKYSPCNQQITDESYSRVKPTLESPTDIKSHGKGIYIVLKSIYVYNKNTGEILASIDL
jgi:hypothetical protein